MAFHGQNRTITVDRSLLIGQLKENLKIHKKDYAEAVVGYKIKLLEDLQNKIDQVNAASDEDTLKISAVQFSPPRSYEKEYADAITMLEWQVGETTELDQISFKQFVQNEWAWSQSFDTMNTMYKASALAGPARR